MASTRPWWAIVVGGVLVALVLGMGLGCGESQVDEGATCTIPSSAATTAFDEVTTLDETTTVDQVTTVPGDVDITAQLVGVWDCVDMPGDYTIEFTAYGYGETYQQGEAGDIYTEFEYEVEGDLVTLYYVDDMMQTLRLSADGTVLTEAEPYGAFSFKKQ